MRGLSGGGSGEPQPRPSFTGPVLTALIGCYRPDVDWAWILCGPQGDERKHAALPSQRYKGVLGMLARHRMLLVSGDPQALQTSGGLDQDIFSITRGHNALQRIGLLRGL